MHRDPDGTRSLVRRLKELYGDDAPILTGVGESIKRHARHHEVGMAYHVISKVFQGRFLMRPDKAFNTMAAGVIGRAQKLCRGVELYAYAFMLNHMHMQLSGPPDKIPAFIGFVKKEISRRLGWHIGWRGTMWHTYASTALPTEESQLTCLRYILSHGVKEKLVRKATQWPGLHAAKQLLFDKPAWGEWLDATEYGEKVRREERKKKPRPVRKADYVTPYTIELSVLPVWRGHTAGERRALVAAMLNDIEAEGERLRGGKPPLGVKAILATPRDVMKPPPPPPWYTERRRMVAWANPNAPETKAHRQRYWDFQVRFAIASWRYRAGELDVDFPPGAFRPPSFRHPPPD